MKTLVDINNTLGSKILGGVNYAGWGCRTGKPRTKQEWNWSVEAMRDVAKYAKETGKINIAVECINRFETHFLNIASDGVFNTARMSVRTILKCILIVSI